MNHEQLLTDVFRAYYDARKHKRNTMSQLRFEMNLEDNLVQLAHDIENRTYEVGRSICFIVERPVKREVFAADFRDRVVHHLLYNYLSPLLERTFIHDCYSCRKGYGTLKGINRVAGFVRRCTRNFKQNAYVLKLDISGYFMSINRRQLLSVLIDTLDKYADRTSANSPLKWKELLDYDLLTYLLTKIVLNDPKADCLLKGSRSNWKGLPKSKSLFHAAAGCGLPIGNLTSQLFSNVYLARLDHYVKREEHARFYGRYVDDFVVVSADKENLKTMTVRIERKLNEWGLVLHPHKRYLQHATKGFDFDDTYYDLAQALKPRTRGKNYKSFADVRSRLNNVINGRIEFNDGKNEWIFKDSDLQQFSISLTSEGIKKISILDVLLGNHYLSRNSAIFIDEPESALHPQFVSNFVEMIFELSKCGIQFFIASHSYFVIKKLYLLAHQHNESVPVISFLNSGIEQHNLRDEMQDNPIIQESINLYHQELAL